MCSAEKNRLHKVLVDVGMRLSVLVSDIHGRAARAMIKALIDDRPFHEELNCKGRLWASRDELFDALSREQFGTTHRFVADEILQHIEPLEQRKVRVSDQIDWLHERHPHWRTIGGLIEVEARRQRSVMTGGTIDPARKYLKCYPAAYLT